MRPLPVRHGGIDHRRMKISQWPEGDRPRERLRTHGPGSLSDAELLAVLIGSGTRERDAVSMGREMIASAGSLARLMQAMPHNLATPGIGPAKAARIAAALEIARRVINGGVTDRTLLRDFNQPQIIARRSRQRRFQRLGSVQKRSPRLYTSGGTTFSAFRWR